MGPQGTGSENGVTVRKGRTQTGPGVWTDESTATPITPPKRQQFADTAARYYIENPNASKEDYIENNKVVNSRWITFTFQASNVRSA